MEYIIDDDFNYVNLDVNLNKKDKTIPAAVDNSVKNTPKFLSKEEREKIRIEEESKKEEEKKKKELENKSNLKKYISSKYQDNNRDRDRYRNKDRDGDRDYQKNYKYKDKKSRSRSSSRNRDYKVKDINASENLEDKEIEAIKNQYLGLNREKRRMVRPSEKFKNIFNFDWDKEEDTSADINPIYKNAYEPHLLFGRGIRGGFDIKEQKKKTKEYERLLKEERSKGLDEDEFEGKDKKKRRVKSRSRSRNRSGSRKRRGIKEADNNERETHWSDKTATEMSERDWRIFREDNDIIIKGGRVPHPMSTWEEGNLPEYIQKTIKESGYKKPSAIQMQGIPIGLEKRDMIGLAPTGSGKSAAFLIPLIIYLNSLPPLNPSTAHNGPYAIIIAPSRELALQIYEEFKKFAKYTKLKGVCLVGGRSGEDQAVHLGMGVEVIIGTPGRIQDSLERQYTTLNQCHYVVLDEADKMIKEDFEESLNFILDCIPDTNLKSQDEKIAEEQERECKQGNKKFRITMMFSATMSSPLEKLARKFLRCPSYISIGEPGAGKKEIEQKVEFVQESQKKERLRALLNRYKPPVMVFVNHKKAVDLLCKSLEKTGYKATALHGSKKQEIRENALKGFKTGKFNILVCTNVAARGIDVEGVSLVVNFDCPDNIDDYMHRIGRTGRAEMKGVAVTFITNNDEAVFYDLKAFLEHNDQVVPQDLANHPASKFKSAVKKDKKDHVPRSKQVLYTA